MEVSLEAAMQLRGIAAAICGLFILGGVAECAEITVLASGAMKEIVTELLPIFEKASGHTTAITWSGTAKIKQQIASGESYDLVIVGAPEIDTFIEDGKIRPGTRVDVVRSGVGVAIKLGAAKPDISSVPALKNTLLNSKSVAYSTGPSGIYVLKMFEIIGVGAEMKPRLIQTPSGTRVGDYLRRGEAEIGFQQIAELIHETGIDFLGPLPPEIQNITLYSSGIHTAAKQPDAAKTFQTFLTSPEAMPIIKKSGMAPAK